MPWNAQKYLAFGGERTRPAADLLVRLPNTSPQTIVDLGCGPGNSTALLQARFPEASLVGLDSSEDMLNKARAANVRASFVLGDITSFEPEEPVDIMFANASLHWVNNHERQFPKLLGFVAKGGSLAVQMPNNFREPTHALLRQIASLPAFAEQLAGKLQPVNVLDACSYHRLLTPFGQVDLWETTYLHSLAGEDAVLDWVRGTTLLPVRKTLSASAYAEFEREYGAALKVAYPQEKNGRTLLPFRRIFLVVQKTT